MYTLAYGIFIGWTQIENDSYSGLFNVKKVLPPYVWLIVPVVGYIFFGFIAMKFGKKTSLLLTSIPMIVSTAKDRQNLYRFFLASEKLIAKYSLFQNCTHHRLAVWSVYASKNIVISKYQLCWRTFLPMQCTSLHRYILWKL